jgi:hypothetical protein
MRRTTMTRLTPAARQLIAEVQKVNKDATADPHGDPDSFGVTRSVRFDSDTGAWLKDALDAVGDSRIASYKRDAHGFTVEFVGTHHADRKDAFDVGGVNKVLTSEPEEPVEEPKKAVKKAAKKPLSPDN